MYAIVHRAIITRILKTAYNKIKTTPIYACVRFCFLWSPNLWVRRIDHGKRLNIIIVISFIKGIQKTHNLTPILEDNRPILRESFFHSRHVEHLCYESHVACPENPSLALRLPEVLHASRSRTVLFNYAP